MESLFSQALFSVQPVAYAQQYTSAVDSLFQKIWAEFGAF